MLLLGRTDTIRERAVWVYLSSVEQRERWKRLAEQSGWSLSNWVLNMVEKAINPAMEELPEDNRRLRAELQELKHRVEQLQEKVRQLSVLKERFEEQLRKYRSQPFIEPGFSGEREYSKELVQLLRETKTRDGRHKPLANDEILSGLGIKPDEEQAVKAVTAQPMNLQAYGLVSYVNGRWVWRP